MYRCPNCGGEMRFSPEKQLLVCDFCDSEFSVDEFDDKKGVNAEEHTEAEAQEKDAGSEDDEKYFEATVFTCPQCGGELVSMSDTAATFCSFCGASVLLESRVSREMRPDCIIPFKKSKEECTKAYKKMLSKALFVPSEMKKDSEIEKFRSIYMPYWIYDYEFHGAFSARGQESHRSGDYIITRTYALDSEADAEYSGISFDASSSFSDSLSTAVAPFDIKEAVDFKPAYMTGHYADAKDLEFYIYEEDAKKIIRTDMAEKICDADSSYEKHGADEDAIARVCEPKLKGTKLGFFPVWFLSGRNKAGDRVSYAVMNGQTGKIAADLPVSMPKYLLGSLILAVPIFLLMNFVLNLTFTPKFMLIAALIIGVICILVVNYEANKAYSRENDLDDKGRQAVLKRGRKSEKTARTKNSTPSFDLSKIFNKGTVSGVLVIAFFIFLNSDLDMGILQYLLPVLIVLVILMWVTGGIKKTKKKPAAGKIVTSAPFSEKKILLLKPLAGIILAGVLILINPNQDIIPYAAGVIAMALNFWSFTDIIKKHNELTMRKLPQLGRRGGDEDA
ncbi:MAG: hypothetical protein IKR00_01900 [Lachnospiraceae bacterium]|nr:hypothetical protein [Lachnospiraceae bacterium]